MQNHLFRRFPFGSFPAPARFFCPAPDVAAYILLPFSSSSLLFVCSHCTSGTILFSHYSLNPFLYFHFTLQMMLELKNLLSFELIKCSFFAYLFTISVPYHYSYADYQQNCSDLQRAGWLLGLIMMIILSKYDHDIEDRLAWL